MTIQINGTSGISGVDGSAATPALQGTDTNTGISFGTDEVNINTGGTTRATVDSSGVRIIRDAESFSGFQRTGATSTNDYIGAVIWRAQNSAGTDFEYAKVNIQITDNTAGSENSKLYFESRQDGTMYSALELVNGVHNFPRLPYCTGGQNGGWTSFTTSPATSYGILPSNGNFFTNANDGFYAGSLLNGYRVIHARHAGVYLFMLTIYRDTSFDARLSLLRNNSHEFGFIESCTVNSDATFSMTCIETLAASDYVNYQFTGSGGGSLYTGDNHTTLSIVKIG